ncbi:MAG: Rpn family recombination-promoting nuclease/putative transposase [Bradymonadia bacterium]
MGVNRHGAPIAFPLPAIIPVVLYHGAARWTAPQAFAELLDLNDESRSSLEPYLLQLRYRLEDLGAYSEAELLTESAALPHMLGMAFVLMRAVVRQQDLLTILSRDVIKVA